MSFQKTAPLVVAPIILREFHQIADSAQRSFDLINQIRVARDRLRDFADRFQNWRRGRQEQHVPVPHDYKYDRDPDEPEENKRSSRHIFPYYYPHYFKKTARRLWMPFRRRLGRRPVRLAFRRVRPWRVRGYRRYRRRRYY